MKRLLTVVAFFATLHASAQQVNPVPDYVFRNQMSVGRGTVTDTAAYFSIGPRYGAVKGFMPPIVVDTASFSGSKRNGLLIFSVQKNKFLYWDSVRVQWSDMAGSSGSYITGTLTTNYIPKATGSTTLGNSVMYDSSGHVRVYGNYVGNTNPNRLLFTSEISGNNGYTALFKQSDSIADAGQFPLILRKGLLTTDKPRPNFGVGLETQLQDDAGTWKRSGFIVNRIVDSTAANFRTKFDFTLINGSTYPIPLIVSGDSSIRMAKLAGSGTRYVVADANGDISATSATALVDTTTISTRAWRQKGLDSLAALEVSGSGTTNYVPKFTASSTIGNSIIFDNGTRIGIGLDTPDAQLTVQTVASFADGLVATPSIAHRGDLNTGIWFPGTDILAFSTAGLERMRFTSSGRLLIGKTTEGTFLLDVNGGVKADGGIIESNAASPVVQSKLNTADAQVVRIYMNGTDGVIGVTRNSGTVPNLTFATEGGERMRLTNGSELLINTTSDAGNYNLQVSGNIYNTGSITTGAPSGGSIKPWKIGEAATVSPTSPNRTIRVEIDGTVYYLHAKTTND